MKILLLILLVTFFFNRVSAQQSNDSLIQKISTSIDSMPNGFAISIAILKDGKVDYIGFIKEDDQLTLSNLKDSLFEIGSLTKVFTSTLLADEVVNKNIKLKASVNKAFSFKFNDKIKLSYLDLSNHTSGMYRLPSNIMPMLFENPNNPYSQYSYDLFNDYLKSELQLDDNEVPKYTYSNLGAGLLAYALSNRKGQEFESLLKG